MTPEEMFRKLEYLPGVQREEYELEGAVDTDLTLPAGHVIMTRFGHVEWGGIRRRTYVWEYGEEATEYYLCNPRSDTPRSHRFVARSSLRLISPEDAETTAEQPAVRAEAAEEERAELRAANEALAELAASETERRVALAERVAELEAAQQWRPVTEDDPTPLEHVVIQTRDGADVGWRLPELRHLWQTRRGRTYVNEELRGWLALPPLPPPPAAPQEPTP